MPSGHGLRHILIARYPMLNLFSCGATILFLLKRRKGSWNICLVVRDQISEVAGTPRFCAVGFTADHPPTSYSGSYISRSKTSGLPTRPRAVFSSLIGLQVWLQPSVGALLTKKFIKIIDRLNEPLS